jgi:hypothetical protein
LGGAIAGKTGTGPVTAGCLLGKPTGVPLTGHQIGLTNAPEAVIGTGTNNRQPQETAMTWGIT